MNSIGFDSSKLFFGNFHAVGLDLHKKLLMMKEMESNMIRKHKGHKTTSSYDLPKEIYVIEDDDKKTSSHTPTEELHVLNKLKETSSM